MKLTFVIGAILLISVINAEQPEDQATMVPYGTLSSLKETVRENRLTLVLFSDYDSELSHELRKVHTAVYNSLRKKKMAFVQIKVKPDSARQNKFILYIEGQKKTYKGEESVKSILEWMKETIAAKPLRVERLSEIPEIDNHYFVFAEDSYYHVYKQSLQTLAQLITPIVIVHGLPNEEIAVLLKGREPAGTLWAYREYGDEIIDIDLDMKLGKMAEYIHDHEYPEYFVPNKAGIRLLTEFKVPTMIYFTKNNNDSFIESVKELALPFREYIIPTIVDVSRETRYSKFLMEFMGITKLPALRILSMADKLERFKFAGKKEPILINNFITNYLQHNLEPYTINEKLKPGQMTGGVKKANFNKFKEIMKDVENTYLVLIYSRLTHDLPKYFEILREVQAELEFNTAFEVLAINHDKNDLDGYYNDALPFYFVASTKNHFHHYEGNTNAAELLQFVVEEVPHLKKKSDIRSTDL